MFNFLKKRRALAAERPAWRHENKVPSLPEVNSSVKIGKDIKFWRKMLAFAGPGYMVAVGYMDPGNWATDLAGGFKIWLYTFERYFDFKFNGDSFAVALCEVGRGDWA
jgi:hypothetical protein